MNCQDRGGTTQALTWRYSARLLHFPKRLY